VCVISTQMCMARQESLQTSALPNFQPCSCSPLAALAPLAEDARRRSAQPARNGAAQVSPLPQGQHAPREPRAAGTVEDRGGPEVALAHRLLRVVEALYPVPQRHLARGPPCEEWGL